ncbi:DUF551 domain-containing protein [Escherichia coli]
MTTMNREEQKQVLIDTANHIINRDNTSPYSENLRELARIALASLAAVSDERAAYELFMEKRFGESVDHRRAKNGDREYMAWDMELGWIIWCHRAAMLQGGQPVNQTYNLPELIEGMEVSIDVSTCDADLGNRYFGTVTEALELDTAKNGYILLVQDAEPNFDVNGNYPVTPDGWISCSERMPDDGQHVIILCDGAFVLYAQYRDGEFFDIVRNGEEFFETHSRNVTHWMPLPEPPQEAK